jgi:hypothetical protein
MALALQSKLLKKDATFGCGDGIIPEGVETCVTRRICIQPVRGNVRGVLNLWGGTGMEDHERFNWKGKLHRGFVPVLLPCVHDLYCSPNIVRVIK